MKKLKEFGKKNIKVLVAFVIGLMLSGVGVYAATYINSENVAYDNSSSGLSSTDLQGTIDEVYTKTQNALYKKTCKDCPKCIRTSTLHTETCSQTSTSSYCGADGYAEGDTITYGSTGTSGSLTTGDAFDCDVNGDSIYDSNTERFYYVTDMDTNTAILTYYNNVSGGVASNSTTYAYDSSGVNNNGPVTAIEQLSTTTQWLNVSLTNAIRAITSELVGTTTPDGDLPTAFSYEGYVARLLTYQEVNTACYDGTTVIKLRGGLSSECKFLFENTKYSSSSINTNGLWLKTPFGDASKSA